MQRALKLSAFSFGLSAFPLLEADCLWLTATFWPPAGGVPSINEGQIAKVAKIANLDPPDMHIYCPDLDQVYLHPRWAERVH
jgi:hypothetical protein